MRRREHSGRYGEDKTGLGYGGTPTPSEIEIKRMDSPEEKGRRVRERMKKLYPNKGVK